MPSLSVSVVVLPGSADVGLPARSPEWLYPYTSLSVFANPADAKNQAHLCYCAAGSGICCCFVWFCPCRINRTISFSVFASFLDVKIKPSVLLRCHFWHLLLFHLVSPMPDHPSRCATAPRFWCSPVLPMSKSSTLCYHTIVFCTSPLLYLVLLITHHLSLLCCCAVDFRILMILTILLVLDRLITLWHLPCFALFCGYHISWLHWHLLCYACMSSMFLWHLQSLDCPLI